MAALQTEFADKGFTVLGFYCNQFSNQAGSLEKQKEKEAQYGVTFPVFGLVNVNPPDEHPVFSWLKGQPAGAGKVDWNFTKWLVGRDGTVLQRWETSVAPSTFRDAIEAAL